MSEIEKYTFVVEDYSPQDAEPEHRIIEVGIGGPQGIGFSWKGVWDPAIGYATRDVVYHGGSAYVSLQNTNLNNEPNPEGDAYWEPMIDASFVETLRDDAQASADAAAISEANAEMAQSLAESARDAAQLSETNAGTSAANAAASETNAAASESNASASEAKAGQWAEELEDVEVEPGQFSALHHKEKALDAQAAAEAAQAGAETSEINAASSESNAATSASNAASSEDNAAASESNAATSETNALASENKAYRWAEEAEDIEVEPGEYSAYHWAKKAEYYAPLIEDQIVDGVTGKSASQNAVFDALATKVNTSDYEDVDVLNKVKNVDGSGSGLDADLLDGQHASAFVMKSGDTMTGPLNFSQIACQVKGQIWSRIVNITTPGVYGSKFRLTVTGTRSSVVFSSVWDIATQHSLKGSLVCLTDEGYEPTRLRLVIDSNGNGYVEMLDTARDIPYGQLQTVYVSIISTLGTATPITTFTDGTTVPSEYVIAADATEQGNTISYNGNKIWHAGNDGSGSGLDADLLDGKHATSFVLTTDYENADVLAKVKAVDGAGSGLDADLLDGKHLSEIGGGGMSHQVFTSSGTFTVPSGVTNVKVTLIGGGGGGSGGTSSSDSGSGGGGGGVYYRQSVNVTSGSNIYVTIGSGGAGGSYNGGNGSAGGASSFGSYLTATGGGGGTGSGSSGVGGAAGSPSTKYYTQQGGNGPTNELGGAGGGTILGGPAAPVYSSYNHGLGFGCGGTGGGWSSSGGDGSPGVCIVEWEE